MDAAIEKDRESSQDNGLNPLARVYSPSVGTNTALPLPILDSAVVAVLENGDRVLCVRKYGISLWAETFRIDCRSAQGSLRSYFLKTLNVKAPDAANRVYGEYEAMSAIYNTHPGLAPKPRGYGQCNERRDTYFFACDFLNISHNLPDAVNLGKRIAELHCKSQSPTGNFGFHCATFDGKNRLNTGWESSWTRYFRRLMQDVYKLEQAANGYWKEFDDVMQITFNKLIPRLLDALTADGRTIKPTLIHGDLWESNIGTDKETGEVYIFDACAYYAHHEKELGIWRCAHHQMTDETYRQEYFKHYPPSEPKEEADDRNRLYMAQTMVVTSIDFPEKKIRELLMSELGYLINKYRLG